jgi:hypothetical protein
MVGLVHKISDYYFLLEVAFIKKMKEKVNSVFFFLQNKNWKTKKFCRKSNVWMSDTGTK